MPVFAVVLVPAVDDSVVRVEKPPVRLAVPPTLPATVLPPPTARLASNPLLVAAVRPVLVATDSCRRRWVDVVVPTSSTLTGTARIRTTPPRLPCGLPRLGETTQPFSAAPRLSRIDVGDRNSCNAVRPGAPSFVTLGCN